MTGSEGFVGSWLVPHLERSGQSVVCTHRPRSPAPPHGSRSIEIDLRDRQASFALLREVRPARIVHLAAVAYPPSAASDPLEALRVNYGAVDHLLGAMAEHAPDARLLYVGTGAVYGSRGVEDPPFREEEPLAPPTPYAATKAAAEQRVALAVEREGLDAVILRPFNHSGPGRPDLYAESSFARQITRIERGRQEPRIRVGNLDFVREMLDVRDVVRAYALLLERGERGGIYNVCTGVGRSIGSILDTLLSLSGSEARVEVDPDRYRPAPPERLALVGDPARLRRLGWSAELSFEETLRDLLEDWRERD